MKLPVKLLNSLAVAIALSSAASCTKQKTLVTPGTDKPELNKDNENKPKNPAFNCPACGMG